MSRTLYLECSSGISGDMTAAALLDLGASEEAVRRALSSLPVEGFDVFVTRVKKSGLDVCDFEVRLDEQHENRDHDMAYLHGIPDKPAEQDVEFDADAAGDTDSAVGVSTEAAGGAGSEADADACADASNTPRRSDGDHPHGNAHHHEHRGLADVTAIIDAADMTDGAKANARRIFSVIADAEAKAHGTTIEEVHFHEVGAVDSIADIVAIAVAIDDLAPDEIVVTELCEGRGTVRCQHGIIPVPAPAVANITSAHGIALRILDVQGELVTPTGAAVVAAMRTTDALPDRFVIDRVGMGAGKRAYATPGILRAMLITPAPTPE